MAKIKPSIITVGGVEISKNSSTNWRVARCIYLQNGYNGSLNRYISNIKVELCIGGINVKEEYPEKKEYFIPHIWISHIEWGT